MGFLALVWAVSTFVRHRACQTIGMLGQVYLLSRSVCFFYMTQQSASRPLISLDQLKCLAKYFLAMSGVFHNAQKLGFNSRLLQCIACYQHCSKQFCCIPQGKVPSCET